jgi:glucose-1-phosphate thymidylyltransferase
MKGVILAGGLGTRLYPLTKISNKHLLPIYDQPMINYPIKTLVDAGIDDILIVVSGPHSGAFIPILKNGEDFNCKISYAYQDKPDGGIADALKLARSFVGNDNVCVILGDNVTDFSIKKEVQSFNYYIDSSHVFLKEVSNPEEFGVVKLSDDMMCIEDIIEKPEVPPSNYIVTGIYLYTNIVFDYIDKCEVSKRNQLEITDVNKMFLQNKFLEFSFLNGFWLDAGTFDNLYLANQYYYTKKTIYDKEK